MDYGYNYSKIEIVEDYSWETTLQIDSFTCCIAIHCMSPWLLNIKDKVSLQRIICWGWYNNNVKDLSCRLCDVLRDDNRFIFLDATTTVQSQVIGKRNLFHINSNP